eukprot:scaffold24178_cov21-Tisochrysis_lutea.AAC.5
MKRKSSGIEISQTLPLPCTVIYPTDLHSLAAVSPDSSPVQECSPTTLGLTASQASLALHWGNARCACQASKVSGCLFQESEQAGLCNNVPKARLRKELTIKWDGSHPQPTVSSLAHMLQQRLHPGFHSDKHLTFQALLTLLAYMQGTHHNSRLSLHSPCSHLLGQDDKHALQGAECNN